MAYAVLSSGMSDALWYRNKAAECGRLAASATDVAVNKGHLRDQANWNEIAKSIEIAEEAIKARKSK